MLCPKCGTENTNQTELCTNCNESLLSKSQIATSDKSLEPESEQTDQIKTRIHDDSKEIEKELNNSLDREKPVVSIGLNIAVIVGTIIFPIIGIAMGYTYYRKDHPDAKRAGKNWLILGIIIFLANILLVNSMK